MRTRSPSLGTADHHMDTVPARGPARAPVLCLHGLFAGAWVFDALLPRLAARGHPASALSFRQHAPLPAGPDLGRLRVADFAADAEAAARALDRPVVIGHSLGGLVAQLLVARGLARACVLLSSAPPGGIPVLSGPVLVRMARYLPALLFSRPFKPNDADLDAIVVNRVAEPRRAAVRDRLGPDSGRAAREVALGTVRVPRERVTVPLLVMSGDHDRFVPLGVARRIAARYRAPLHVMTGHGHFLFAEPAWEREAEVMLDWIGENSAG